ncbi:uncharacterized protein JCM15063_003431 [Sporobolomyces koalae]|uniref:uncharacterized protein n=1 Tax=Sporobolomyces koalae TaxID=500713 RepID=UPI00317ABAEF
MPPLSAPPWHRRRLTMILIAIGLLWFHWVVAAKLSNLSESLKAVLGETDGNERGGEDEGQGRLYGIIALVRIARLWSLCSVAIAGCGIYAILTTSLPLLRLFTLNSFLSIALDLFLLLLSTILVSVSSSSSRSITTTICQTLSNSNSPSADDLGWGLPDLLGLSLEACEERFASTVVTSLTIFGVVEGVRAYAAIQLLGYYAQLASSRNASSTRAAMAMSAGPASRRRQPSGSSDLRIDTAMNAEPDLMSERYYTSPVDEAPSLRSPSSSKGKGKAKDRDSSGSSRRATDDARIFLLPRPTRSDGEAALVPLVSVTPSSPHKTSFPLPSDASCGSENARMVTVYQPVMMSIEEARQHGASELIVSKTRRSRSWSSSGAQHHRSPPSTGSSSDRRSRSSTITASTPMPSSSKAAPLRSPLSVVTTSSPPPVSSPSLASNSSRTFHRQDSDDLLTPTAGPQTPSGFAGLLLGDFETETQQVDKDD